jgi:hypothetical protein
MPIPLPRPRSPLKRQTLEDRIPRATSLTRPPRTPWQILRLRFPAGVPLTQVRDVLGHSSVTMTERYAHLAPDSVRAAVSVLDDPPAGESRYGHATDTQVVDVSG